MVAWIAPAAPVGDRVRRAALRLAAAGVLAGGLGALQGVHLPRPATICPLRALTGVPCPMCGTTTALARLGRLDLTGALAANPFSLGLLAALVLLPLFGPVAVAAWMRRPRWQQCTMAGLGLAGAWWWQLARFDVLLHQPL